MNILLRRTMCGKNATTGTLTAADKRWFTIEREWCSNLEGHSCVPMGTYELVPYNSPKHGPTWCLHGPLHNIFGPYRAPPNGRSFCEIHAANWARELAGCIAVGEGNVPMFDRTTGQLEPAVEKSSLALKSLLDCLGPMTSGHMLSIINGFT